MRNWSAGQVVVARPWRAAGVAGQVGIGAARQEFSREVDSRGPVPVRRKIEQRLSNRTLGVDVSTSIQKSAHFSRVSVHRGVDDVLR